MPAKRPPNAHEELYWQRVRRITGGLLLVWMLLILGIVLFVPQLHIHVYGVPLTYWLISTVLLISFLGLVICYAWRMDRLESKFKRAVENNRHASGDSHEKQHRGGGQAPF
ncbi:DUF4212 domain-containing protein [Limnobacter sp.]|uniref:DUF4212 domain-containing protein n=1 Tax=Limnobacter sp. TaxID=2003368 RepID=UPI0035192FB1